MIETFGLPENYQINPANITVDQDNTFYWDEDRVSLSKTYQFATYKWAAEIIREKNIETIFDVGCGFAAKLAWLNKKFPHKSFWGIDQPNAAEHCQRHYDFGNWLGVDFENDPATPPVLAGLTISSDVIEHLVNPDALLNYLRRLTAPGGYILISTPERVALRGENCLASPNPYHVREWSKAEFALYLESRGFKVIEHKILPGMKASLSRSYAGQALRQWAKGRNMRFNQTVLLQAS